MVLICILQERVVRQILVKSFVQVKQIDNVHLYRICLIEETVVDVSGVSVGGGYYVPGVFRAVLVVV